MLSYEIVPATHEDVGEIFTLQRAAYVKEAQLYGDPMLPALVQTLSELEAELSSSIALKAVIGTRIVGAVRAYARGGVLHIGRITIAPDLQGQGIGSALLDAIELQAPEGTDSFVLFTGHLSESNLGLYDRKGYHQIRTEHLSDAVELVILEKQVS